MTAESHDEGAADSERTRLIEEHRRRERDIAAERYAPWNPGEMFMREGRRRVAARLLHEAGVFPTTGDACLEVGYGRIGWLPTMMEWGLCESDLHGIELDAARARAAQAAFPVADLRVGDACHMPWPEGTFQLVIASTVFSSILDASVRQLLSADIERVLKRGGALLWYDLGRDNPRNRAVKGIAPGELPRLFPHLAGPIRRTTLAPPLARLLAPWSWGAAAALEAIPFLRTHVLAVLTKR